MQIRTLFTFTSIIVALCSNALAQSQLEWFRAHDSTFSQADYGRQCAVDAAGNVYVSGRSYNPSVGVPPMPPQADFELVKYDASGVQQWVDRYDAFGSEDSALDLQISPAGDVYVSGYGWNGNDIDLVLMKFTPSGRDWVRTFAGAGGGSDFGRAIGFDLAGNVVVIGQEYDALTNTDALALCWSPLGVLQWHTKFDGGAALADALYAVATLPSGELVAAGQLGVGASQDLALVVLSSGGAFQWQRTLDGGFNLADAGTALTLAGSNRVLVGGYRTTTAAGEDWLLAQYDVASATLAWSANFNGLANGNDRVRSVACDAAGILWVAGTTTWTGTGIDCMTRRYSQVGAPASSDRWNNASANLDDSVFKVLLGNAGQAFVCGYTVTATSPATTSDAFVLQYDATGTRNWSGTYSSIGAFDDRVFDADLAPNARVVLAGYTNSGPSGGYDYMALQVDLGDAPHGYCTAKTNSLGCAATLTFSGGSSVAATSGFVVSAADERNQQNGLFFYSANGAASAPFQGGYMCMLAPLNRAPLDNSGGSASPADDCSGVYSLDVNAYAHGLAGGLPAPALLVAGTSFSIEVWSRDPGASFNTNVSSALAWTVLP